MSSIRIDALRTDLNWKRLPQRKSTENKRDCPRPSVVALITRLGHYPALLPFVTSARDVVVCWRFPDRYRQHLPS